MGVYRLSEICVSSRKTHENNIYKGIHGHTDRVQFKKYAAYIEATLEDIATLISR